MEEGQREREKESQNDGNTTLQVKHPNQPSLHQSWYMTTMLYINQVYNNDVYKSVCVNKQTNILNEHQSVILLQTDPEVCKKISNNEIASDSDPNCKTIFPQIPIF